MDLWRLENFALERLPVVARRLPVPRPRARERARRAPRRGRRGARPHARCATRTGGSSRCPSSSGSRARRSRRCAPTSRGAAAARPPAVEPRAALRVARRWSSTPTRRARSSRGSPACPTGSGSRWCQLRVGDRVLRFFNPAGRGVVVEIDDPPTRPLQPLDEGAQRIVSRPPPRHRPPGGDRQDPRAPARRSPARRSRPASSSSTTSTTTAAARAGRPPGRHEPRRASWSA